LKKQVEESHCFFVLLVTIKTGFEVGFFVCLIRRALISGKKHWKLSGKERVRIPVKPATPNYGKGSYLKLFENSHWQYPIRRKLIVCDRPSLCQNVQTKPHQ
jgi:hypothetical protein